jgi:N-methylhydantoinase A
VVDPLTGESQDVPTYRRESLRPGDVVAGPALIAEDETTTVVTAGFEARLNAIGYIVLERKAK